MKLALMFTSFTSTNTFAEKDVSNAILGICNMDALEVILGLIASVHPE